MLSRYLVCAPTRVDAFVFDTTASVSASSCGPRYFDDHQVKESPTASVWLLDSNGWVTLFTSAKPLAPTFRENTYSCLLICSPFTLMISIITRFKAFSASENKINGWVTLFTSVPMPKYLWLRWEGYCS
jgi:hypothetical protein